MPFPRVGEFNKDKDKEKDKTMISLISKNGKSVRLSADYSIDTETAEFTVYSDGTKFIFREFAPAARVFKRLSGAIEAIEMGGDYKKSLHDLIRCARMMGYEVREPGFCAKEVA